jgi:hypothetical protein
LQVSTAPPAPLRRVAPKTKTTKTKAQEEEARAALALRERLADRGWRLNNLYTVETKRGEVVRFEMNAAQAKLLAQAHNRNIIPKARQLGFTTFIMLMMLDACLFNSNTRCAVIAHDKDAAGELFEQKVRQVYERLPAWLRAAVPARKDQAKQLDFANGSQIRVTTSARSGTVQWLLVSEHGKICAKYPKKAQEIRTGALPAAPIDGTVFVESTGEGPDGDFYEWCMAASRRADARTPLTPLDLKLHFFPWHEEPGYRLQANGVQISDDLQKYFDELADKHGVVLDAEQRAWYAKTWETQRDDMLKEYPSTFEEVFKTAIEGAFFTLEMQALRRSGRLGSVPYEASHGRVHRFWDIGVDDYTAVWFVQLAGRDILLIDYKEWQLVGLPGVLKDLDKLREERGYLYGVDVMPHDIEVTEWGSGLSRMAQARAAGLDIIKAESPPGVVAERIGMIRNAFPRFKVDAQRCAVGVKRLDGYRREWDDRLGVWKAQARHDESSHGASALGIGIQKLELLPTAGGQSASGYVAGWTPPRRTS